ncbi:MAG: hypothetical protein MJE77_34850 [Proteobacteria bacterium]|nr:hypothetical protein [Pseudomonadota bacterium]
MVDKTTRNRGEPASQRRGQRGCDAAARTDHGGHKNCGLEASQSQQGVLEQQLVRFRDKFGREPRSDDPVFFDPDADEPRPLAQDQLADMMTPAGHEGEIRAAQVYAMEKTGLMILKGVNDHLFTAEDKAAWLAAIAEFKSRP